MKQINKTQHSTLIWVSISFFILFYPMLVSIYVFLPIFMGAMSYVLVHGLDKNRSSFIIIAIIYMLNLEINLSLPLFLTIISALLFYVLVYPNLKYFRKCKLCRPLLSVLILDLMYLGSLFAFDFIFETNSIVLDTILLYSLIVDMLIVVFI